MKNNPKTIQIFLPDGNARSIRIAEITSRTIQAIQIPRSKLSEAGNRSEVKNVGLYFLFGVDEETGLTISYIGEAENCHKRISQHNRSKDFWDTAVAVTSKTNSFTKAHAKYLEWYCHEQAVKNNRYQIKNSSIPTKPFISEQMQADLMDNYETIKILLSSLGFPILESIVKHIEPNEILYCKGRGVQAKGQYTEEGFIVFKGSECNSTFVPSANKYVKQSRQKVLDADILEEKNDILIFQKDYLFTSPSSAAAAVLGRSTNGWDKWKDANGNTLDSLKR